MFNHWCLVLFLMMIGNFLAGRMSDQLLVALLSTFVVPIPVGASTGSAPRVLLAGLTPVGTMLLVGTVGRALLTPLNLPGAPADWGWMESLVLILPVACSNALCAPPYRLSILALQSLWVWSFSAMFLIRAQVELPEALLICLMGPLIFMVTAALGRLWPLPNPKV